MFMSNNTSLKGNSRFYGFCKDLLDKLSQDLDFKYEISLIPKGTGTYGVKMKNGNWNGMIGQLIDKVNTTQQLAPRLKVTGQLVGRPLLSSSRRDSRQM